MISSRQTASGEVYEQISESVPVHVQNPEKAMADSAVKGDANQEKHFCAGCKTDEVSKSVGPLRG
jgi:hypothetical protein